MITGILFDMDGVLIDSEPIILQAAISYFASIGLTVEASDFTPFIGAGEERFLCGVAEKYGVTLDFPSARKQLFARYGELARNTGPMNGVPRFFANARKAGLRLALASSASIEKVRVNLACTGLSEGDFDCIVTGEKIKRNKPAPDIYQLAALSMVLSPQDCLVVEDAVNGIVSGKRAGCRVCALTTTFPVTSLFDAGADMVVTSLDAFGDFFSIGEFNALLSSMTSESDDRTVYGANRIVEAKSFQTEQQLFEAAMHEATEKREHAYVPYSGFKVGAAIVSAGTRRIYGGCNVENSSFGATVCAERNAVLHAVSEEGSLGVAMLVVVSDDAPPAPPCAQCLQVLAEFCRPETAVHLVDTTYAARKGGGVHEILRFDELLPRPFLLPAARS